MAAKEEEEAEAEAPLPPPTPKKAKKRAPAKAARAATPDAVGAPSGAGGEQLKAVTPQPQPPIKPTKPAKPAKQLKPATAVAPEPPAAPRSAPKAAAAAEPLKAKASSDGADAARPQAPAPPIPAAPAAPADPAAAAANRPEPQAKASEPAATDTDADTSQTLSPAEAAMLWAQQSAESDEAVPVSRPELRRGARGGRVLTEAIEETLVAAGKAAPRPRTAKAALPKKRRKAQRGPVMKTLDPEAMRELLTPSPVAAQQAQQAGMVVLRPRASPIMAPAAPSAARGGGDGKVAGDAAVAAPGLSARPVQPEAMPDSGEADAEVEGMHA